jgi:hypothetical protein
MLMFTSGLTTIATTITIISLAIGPFVQQSIKSQPCLQPLPGTNVEIPVACFVSSTSTVFTPSTTSANLDLQNIATVFNGLMNLQNANTTFSLNVLCSTGNCTIPDLGGYSYKTLGMCSQCFDTTSNIMGQNTTFTPTIEPEDYRLPPPILPCYVYVLPGGVASGGVNASVGKCSGSLHGFRTIAQDFRELLNVVPVNE